jgi:hypothetical protein
MRMNIQQTKRKTFGATCVRSVNNTWYATDTCFRNRRFVPEIIHAASIYKNHEFIEVVPPQTITLFASPLPAGKGIKAPAFCENLNPHHEA